MKASGLGASDCAFIFRPEWVRGSGLADFRTLGWAADAFVGILIAQAASTSS